MHRIRDLEGLGPKSEALLAKIGVSIVTEFMQRDPFEMYRQLKELSGVSGEGNVSLNMLYALIGAQSGVKWQEVCRDRKIEILMRLDDMGLAP